MGYLYTMEYYLDIKRNEIRSFVETPKDCDAEWSKSEIEHKYHILMHICEIWKNWHGWSYLQNRNRDTDLENK